MRLQLQLAANAIICVLVSMCGHVPTEACLRLRSPVSLLYLLASDKVRFPCIVKGRVPALGWQI